ncbi:Rieske (2Fe-2S) protein [Pigmentiphaga sp.]|uniref:Rieske (2Fe-2S) protein n=1 Tax=Pigmentiphaga sp. TaxID=1977564 RepID=UPI0025E38BF8|nr:Rieske (2Fe-2S) protein [Pigmentiphaga sp.]MBX6318295.1 Rieske (2Fe-2S) protein [Pigmentiphaga sp.]
MNHAPHSEAHPWCAVAASRDVPVQSVIPVMLEELSLAVWRSSDGSIHAWHDRCPHRGMRLSMGDVAEKGLVCPYHGWRFGGDAQCNFIPAHPGGTPPAAARVRPYPAVERNGYIWVARQDTSVEPPSLPAGVTPVRSMHMPVSGERLAGFWTRACLHATGRFSRVESSCPETALFQSYVEGSGSILHGKWQSAGLGVDYVGIVQPTHGGTCMLHLAAQEPLSAEARLGLNRALVALRHEISRSTACEPKWGMSHECV